jgi:hypothetical protein
MTDPFRWNREKVVSELHKAKEKVNYLEAVLAAKTKKITLPFFPGDKVEPKGRECSPLELLAWVISANSTKCIRIKRKIYTVNQIFLNTSCLWISLKGLPGLQFIATDFVKK